MRPGLEHHDVGAVSISIRFRWSIDTSGWRPRHMVNISDRWRRDKTDNLQFAFFNGIGWESWENVWGIWNGITPRDAEALRRMSQDRARSGRLSFQPRLGTLLSDPAPTRVREPLAIAEGGRLDPGQPRRIRSLRTTAGSRRSSGRALLRSISRG